MTIDINKNIANEAEGECTLIFCAFDGDYVIESEFCNLESARERWDEIGSRWVFYPIGFIVSGTRDSISSAAIIDVGLEPFDGETGEMIDPREIAETWLLRQQTKGNKTK